MTTQFTTDDYLKAINRELGKRATTYPKILKKMERQGVETDDILTRKQEMRQQNERLQYTKNALERLLADRPYFYKEALDELIRELKERKRCYARWVKLYRMMSQETADYEIAVWESLTRWFAKEYLDLDELPTKRKKKHCCKKCNSWLPYHAFTP